ncbi:MAG: hypothetical protein JJU45_08240 [Acidimicrobiia bacterium]|nr:hypothetical protein [Acidimicrobiia bacterium]
MPKKKRRCPQCGAKTAVTEPRCRVCAHLFVEDGVAPTAGVDRAAFGGGVLSKTAGDEVPPPQPPVAPAPGPPPAPEVEPAEPLSWDEVPDLVGPVASTAPPSSPPPPPAGEVESFDPDALLRDLGGDIPKPGAAPPPPPLPPEEKFDPNAIFEGDD